MKNAAGCMVMVLATLCCARAGAQQPLEDAPAVSPAADASTPESAQQPAAAPAPAEATPTPTPATPDTTAEAPDVAATPALPSLGTEPESEWASNENLLMSPQELAALGIEAEAPAVDTSLKFSGFADVGFGTIFAPNDSYWRGSGAAPPHSTFLVGNVNLYAQKRLTETLSFMTEVRFSYLPNGSAAFGFGDRQTTNAFDYTDFGRATRWGSIILQRVYLDWTPHPLFTLRAGQFLTPYGVWNVDHGSPVFIPVRRPWSIGVGWIPERQTGLEAYGRADISSVSTIGYHLTLSNGTGPISEYADLDENKAVGGRLYWELRGLGFGWLRIGASAYYGRDTDSQRAVTISPGGKFKSRETIASQFDSLTWAADLTWDLGGLHVQTEWIANQRAYTRKGRAATTTLAGRPIIPSDVLSWGGYGLIGYRFSWLGIMPFIMSERVIGELEFLRIKLYTFQFGLNVRPVDVLVLKATFEHVAFEDDSVEPANILMTQMAWAF